MTGFLGAVQFLTRIPIRLRAAAPHRTIVPWFPIVGAGIGAVVGGTAVGLGELVPTGVAAALAVLTGLLITGAFHEDGLADIADAFGGGWTRERRLEILKDPRHGTYGVAALSASIVLRVVCAASIAAPSALFAGFVVAHSLGRSAAVAALLTTPPATDSGLGADLGTTLRRTPASIGIAGSIGLTVLLTGWWAGPLVGATIAGTVAVVVLATRKIGGIAGDVLGAIEQVVECLVLVTVAGLAERHVIWWA